MMSNSRARAFSLKTLLLATAVGMPLGAAASDAPAPAVSRPSAVPQVKAAKAMQTTQRIKIATVSARVIATTDTMVSNMIAEADRAALRTPVLISVQVATPFADLARSASPVIVVNGRALGDSIVPFKEPNRVIAIVRDGTQLDQTIRVQVGWIGDLDRTLSEPVQAQLTR